MPAVQFTVTQRIGKWFVDAGREVHGPYLSKEDAIADAIDAAEQISTRSSPITVILKLRGQDAAVVWRP